MNATRIIHTFTRLACCLLAGALASCIADDLVSPASPETPLSPGLHLNLQVNGETTISTRSAGVDALNENLIETADVFIFNPDEMLNKHAHADNVANNGTVTVYSGSDWLDNFAPDNSYEVYVIANYKGDGNLENITNLDGLKALVAEDPEIVYWEGMNKNTTPGSTTDEMEGKTFLMDGNTTVTYDELAEAAQDGTICTLPVSLYRAAVKVEMTLNFSEAWRKVFQPTGLRIQVANYATRTPAIAGGNPLDPDQRGFQTTPAYGEGTTTNSRALRSENFISARGDNNDWEGSTVRFYAYINRWDDLVENETMLLIDLPGYYKENPDDEGMGDYNLHNFYKVPIIANTEPQALQRNTFYQINATADMLGTSTIDQPVELTNVQFETAPWIEDETVVVGGDDDPSFLILSDYHKVIRDADGFDDLGFYSSSPIKSVELVTGDEALNDPDANFEFDYPGTKAEANDEIFPVYFVNKDGDRQEVNVQDEQIRVQTGTSWGRPVYDWIDNPNYRLVHAEADENVTQGYIRLTSPTPTNVTRRYITLKVTNEDGISKYVVVEQYPLEYIQPIAGYYSYRDDLKEAGGTYEERGTNSGINSNSIYSTDWSWGTSYTYGFVPKVETSNGIRGWYWENQRIQIKNANNYGYSGSFPSNNMMYFVTITQTSEKYNIAHPLTEKVGAYNNQEAAINTQENDQLVSPSFMLASQLGTVLASEFDWNKAREHCAYYVETYTDQNGQTQHLTDWRLPTTAEIEVIAGYQNDDNTNDVMEEVLSGDYYYVAWEDANNGLGASHVPGKGTDRSDIAVRCIRDVKPDDVFLQTNNE